MKKLYKILLCITAVVLAVAMLPLSAFAGVLDGSGDQANAADSTYKHVVVIGVDGGGTFFRNTDTPNIDRIFENGAITYDMITSNPSISAQSWGSLMHGVTPEYHGLNNTVTKSNAYPADSLFPSFFRVIRENDPNAVLASFSHWKNINVGIIEDNLGVHKVSGLSDENLTAEIVTYLGSASPNAMFVQFDEVDGAGHGSGYGSETHFEAITRIDGYIGQIYDAYVNKGIIDETLFIVTADHGGTPGGSHGGWTDAEKYIMFAAAGKTVVKGGTIQDAEIRDTAAIVIHALGLSDQQPDTWTARVPGDLFVGVDAVERPVYIPSAGTESDRYHETVPTPSKDSGKHVTDFVDNDLSVYLPFDGNAEDQCGNTATTENGKLYYVENGYYGDAVWMGEGYVTLKDYILKDQSFTVAMWIQSQLPSGDPPLISNADWSSGYNPGLTVAFAPSYQIIRTNIGTTDTRNRIDAALPSDYKTGWMHLTLSFDRENNQIIYYIDFGASVVVRDFNMTDISFEGVLNGLNIGQDGTGNYSASLDALIDEFMIFDGVFTVEDRNDLARYYEKYGATLTVDGVTTNYASLPEAIDAANAGNGGVITMLADYDYGKLTSADYVMFNKNITIDGQGKYQITASIAIDFYCVSASTTLTLRNLTMTTTTTDGNNIAAIYFPNVASAVVNIENCTIVSTNDVALQSWKNINGQLNISNSTIFGHTYGIRYNNSDHALNISNGSEIYGGSYAILMAGSDPCANITITDSTVSSGIYLQTGHAKVTLAGNTVVDSTLIKTLYPDAGYTDPGFAVRVTTANNGLTVTGNAQIKGMVKVDAGSVKFGTADAPYVGASVILHRGTDYYFYTTIEEAVAAFAEGDAIFTYSEATANAIKLAHHDVTFDESTKVYTIGAEQNGCVDRNNDHKCDYCGATLSECADNDNDHKCDVCGATLSQCADNDKNHSCDVCGKELTTCADGNKDNHCDVCGKPVINAAAYVLNYQKKVYGYYDTVEQALKKTAKYYTLVLMADYEGAGFVINQSITIDLNGFTCTLTDAFEIAEGKTVTFKNGTIKVADNAAFNTLIRNNGTLNLLNVTLDGSKLAENSYVIYNTAGGCYIKEKSDIIVGENGKAYAFNVADGAFVKMADTATINGGDFGVATVEDLVSVIDAAAYVLNYQSKAVFGFYATAEQAIAAATKYYTVVLMKDADCSGKTLQAVASITLKTNGYKFTYADLNNIKVK